MLSCDIRSRIAGFVGHGYFFTLQSLTGNLRILESLA